MTQTTADIYKTTESGIRYIPGFTSFNTSYLNEITYKYDIKTNRVYKERHQLPVSMDLAKMQINELLTSDTINNKIELLYQNYLYLLTRAKIAKSEAIAEYRGPIGLSTEVYSQPVTGAFRSDYNQMLQQLLTGENILDNVTSITLSEHIQYGVDSLIITTNNRLKLFKFKQLPGDGTNCIIKAISDYDTESLVDSNSDLMFTDIRDCVVNARGDSFVLDAGTKIIYKYSLRGLSVDDRILLNKKTSGRILTGKLGGPGAVGEKIRFSAPYALYYNNNQLYVLDKDVDANQYWLKVYDNQLNWVGSFNLSLSFTEDTPIKLAVHDDGTVFILTDGDNLYDYKFSQLMVGNYSVDKKHSLQNIDFELTQDEHYVDLELSTINTNLLYIITNKTIYKKYIDKLSTTIGDIDWAKLNIGSGNVIPLAVAVNDHHSKLGDAMLILGTDMSSSGNHNMLYNCNDEENVMSMLTETYETQIFKLEDIYIKPGEYISAFVYNKMLSKLFFNLRRIIDNIKIIATVEITDMGKQKYPGVRYISREETAMFSIDTDVRDYVGVNELVCTGTLNRCLNRVYQAQELILEMLQDRDNSVEFYNQTTIHMERSPVTHLKHKLPSQVTHRIQKLT